MTSLAVVSFGSAARAGEDNEFEYPGPLSVEHCEAALAREPAAAPPELRPYVDDLVRWITGTHPIFRQAIQRAPGKREIYLLVNLVTGFSVAPPPAERSFFGFSSTDPFTEFARFVDRKTPAIKRQDDGYAQLRENGARLGGTPSRFLSEVIARLVYMSTLCLGQVTDPANVVGPAAKPGVDLGFTVDNVPNAELTSVITITAEQLFSPEELVALGDLANAFREPAIYQRVFRRVFHHREALFAAHARALAAIELHRRASDQKTAVIAAFAYNAPASGESSPGEAADAPIMPGVEDILTFVRNERTTKVTDVFELGRRTLSVLNHALLDLASVDLDGPRWAGMLPVLAEPAVAFRALQTQLDALVDRNTVDLKRLEIARAPFAEFSKWIAAVHTTLGEVDVGPMAEDEMGRHAQRLEFVRTVRERIDHAHAMVGLRADVKRWEIANATEIMSTMSSDMVGGLVAQEPLEIETIRDLLRKADQK